jgi:hypothetical protein
MRKIRPMTDWKPIDLEGLKTYPLGERPSKVNVDDFGNPWKPGQGLAEWVESLPSILAGGDFRCVVEAVVRAVRTHRPVVLAMGAHPIKVGLNPIILDLLDRGIITGMALNGAGIIHDTELSMTGNTSEDVPAQLSAGRFGMAGDTAEFLNEAIAEGARQNQGLGRSIGAKLAESSFPFKHLSLLARGFERNVPVTVHVAIGTDTIHFHPSADGAAIGKTSLLDFRIFARLVSALEEGTFINLGSAVILPEVFLKALSLVKNLGYEVRRFTTVNMDFIRQYRPETNVVHRPTLTGGTGYTLVGHHEIMFPLLAAAVIERLVE